MKKEGYEAIALLTSTIIGAGVLGIPYVVAQSGLFVGLLHIALLGLLSLITNLFVGEISLRTKGAHELSGYAEKYLGKHGKTLMMITVVLSIYGALLAYLIGVGESLQALFGGSAFAFSLGFLIVIALPIYFGLKVIERSELILSGITITVMLFISLLVGRHVDVSNFTPTLLSNIFLPYGVVIFAFAGVTAIPEMREALIKNPQTLKRAIIIGSLIPLVLYLIFTFVVIGVTGVTTTEIATVGLGRALGQEILLLGNLFALFAMTGAFLALSLALKWAFMYDYKIGKNLAFLLTCFVPFALFLAGITTFITVIGFTGAIMGGAKGILILLTYYKAKTLGERKPEYSIQRYTLLSYLILLVLIAGIIYQLVL